MAAPRKYPEEIREAVIARYLKRERLKVIAACLEVPFWTVVSWVYPRRRKRERTKSRPRIVREPNAIG